MNRINPQKLMFSKWTATSPQRREKHFIVIDCQRDECNNIVTVEIEAVLTRRCEVLPCQRMQDPKQWLMGWR